MSHSSRKRNCRLGSGNVYSGRVHLVLVSWDAVGGFSIVPDVGSVDAILDMILCCASNYDQLQ